MNFKTSFSVLLLVFSLTKTIAQSVEYKLKKEKALQTSSPFELIASHRKTDQVLEYEDDDLMVFESLNKQAPIHLLIVPKKRINTLNETDEKHQQMLGKMVLLAKEMAKKKGIDQTGYRLALNTNEDAGQSVFHIHLHLLGGTKLGPIVDQSWRNNQKTDPNREVEEEKDTKTIILPPLEAYLKIQVDTGKFHGVVLVAKGGSIIHHKAYGAFNIATNTPNKLGTQFLIGSLTKSVVASAVMQLVDEGKLNLETPIKQYLPELEDKIAKRVTLHHLLKQQSGLDQYIEDLTEIEVMDITSPELLTLINKAKRTFEPGEKYAYCNLNYNLLAIIIERVTGFSYTNYMQKKIFSPLGMQTTGIERLSNIPAERAVGYRTVNGIFRPIQNVTSYAMGSGDIYATAIDIFKWGQALQRGLLVKEESKKEMFDGGDKDWGYYGYGFRIQPYQRPYDTKEAGTLIRHGGTMNGFASNYHYYKEDDLTVIVLSNNRDIPIRRITYNLKEIALGLQPNQRKNVLLE